MPNHRRNNSRIAQESCWEWTAKDAASSHVPKGSYGCSWGALPLMVRRTHLFSVSTPSLRRWLDVAPHQLVPKPNNRVRSVAGAHCTNLLLWHHGISRRTPHRKHSLRNDTRHLLWSKEYSQHSVRLLVIAVHSLLLGIPPMPLNPCKRRDFALSRSLQKVLVCRWRFRVWLARSNDRAQGHQDDRPARATKDLCHLMSVVAL